MGPDVCALPPQAAGPFDREPAVRNRFDQAAKQIVRGALAPAGRVETDAEVCPEVQRVDVWFLPRKARRGALGALGLLGRLVAGPAALEPFHRTPGEDALRACVRKHLNLLHVLGARAPKPPARTLWVLSSGLPASGLRSLGCRRARGWPPGIYVTPRLLQMGIVVIRQLTVTRETLLLRLLGAGNVLRRAIVELKALPRGAPERRVALPVLMRLRLAIEGGPEQRTREDEEFLMSTVDLLEIHDQRVRGEALAQGLVAALEARFGRVPADVRRLVEASCDEDTLRGWFAHVGAATGEEAFAALRAAARERAPARQGARPGPAQRGRAGARGGRGKAQARQGA